MYITANYASEFLFHNLYFFNLNNSNLFYNAKVRIYFILAILFGNNFEKF